MTRRDDGDARVASVVEALSVALGAKLQGLQADLSTNFGFGFRLAVGILDIIFGSRIVPVPRQLLETAKISNRIVSFLLDGKTHFGTGFLVGPCHVLTAAHLFFGEDGQLIDSGRPSRITIEAHTTYLGNIVMEGPRITARLADRWATDPEIKDGVAQREVRFLDYAIVKLDHPLGDQSFGSGVTRGWFTIPSASGAQILSPDRVLRVFQFLDRGALLGSTGLVRRVNSDGKRVLHTCSTADSSSGAPMVDDDFNLAGVHLGGPPSGEQPKSNRGLPIRRVAEEIDRPREGRSTVREEIGKTCPDMTRV